MLFLAISTHPCTLAVVAGKGRRQFTGNIWVMQREKLHSHPYQNSVGHETLICAHSLVCVCVCVCQCVVYLSAVSRVLASRSWAFARRTSPKPSGWCFLLEYTVNTCEARILCATSPTASRVKLEAIIDIKVCFLMSWPGGATRDKKASPKDSSRCF